MRLDPAHARNRRNPVFEQVCDEAEARRLHIGLTAQDGELVAVTVLDPVTGHADGRRLTGGVDGLDGSARVMREYGTLARVHRGPFA